MSKLLSQDGWLSSRSIPFPLSIFSDSDCTVDHQSPLHFSLSFFSPFPFLYISTTAEGYCSQYSAQRSWCKTHLHRGSGNKYTQSSIASDLSLWISITVHWASTAEMEYMIANSWIRIMKGSSSHGIRSRLLLLKLAKMFHSHQKCQLILWFIPLREWSVTLSSLSDGQEMPDGIFARLDGQCLERILSMESRRVHLQTTSELWCSF